MRTFDEIRADINRAMASGEATSLVTLSKELHESGNDASQGVESLAMGMAELYDHNYDSAISNLKGALQLFEAQDQRKDVARTLNGLGIVYLNMVNYGGALEVFTRALEIAQDLADHHGMAHVLNNLGRTYEDTGSYVQALDAYNQAIVHYELVGWRDKIAATMCNCANVHIGIGDYPIALQLCHRALDEYNNANNSNGIAIVCGIIGNVYASTNNYPTSIEYYLRAEHLYRLSNDLDGLANVLSNLGSIHHSQGTLDVALEYYERAIGVQRQIGKTAEECRNLGALASIAIEQSRSEAAHQFLEQQATLTMVDPAILAYRAMNQGHLATMGNRYDEARDYLTLALTISTDSGRRADMALYHLQLRDYAQVRNDFAGYIEHNNEYMRITDEIKGNATAATIAVQSKHREMESERRERERERALLFGALPKSIAERMIRGEDVSGDHFDNASVLFVDVVGFTTHTSELDATVVVELLQNIFSTFDGICSKHDVTKIKTIGDSYMAVAFGTANAEQRTANTEQRTANVMPSVACPAEGRIEAQQIANSEQRIANVALAMMAIEFVWPHTGERVMFRIGIHSGPVVAGVLGTQRMQYDVWGDTVNVASRMESTSEPGKIHVSSSFALAVQGEEAKGRNGHINLLERGSVDVKGKGMMKTYWLEGA